MNTNKTEEFEIRKDKLKKIEECKNIAYASKFDKNSELYEANVMPDDSVVSVCGRITNYRDFGKFAFLKLYDINGELQLGFK